MKFRTNKHVENEFLRTTIQISFSLQLFEKSKSNTRIRQGIEQNFMFK